MLSFASDYVEGAHEAILQKLLETNYEKLSGYGSDSYSELAREKIREACCAPDADVWLLVGGTQTNQIVIDTMLKPYEGVISAETGHVNGHEAGAIEYTGHKVLALPPHDGKLNSEELRAYLDGFYADANHDHMVFPGMVYVSHPTEYGTLYSRQELVALSDICRTYGIPLFLDGARLGYGLAAVNTDVTLADLATYCDVFYIGGTKVGALCGEAVVFPRHGMPPHFVTMVKQHGALLAKGRLLGVQFDVLFTDDLYLRISRHAIAMAEKMKEIFREKGYPFYLDSPTNQIFVILDREREERLAGKVSYSFWERPDPNRLVARFATSWATREEDVLALAQIL